MSRVSGEVDLGLGILDHQLVDCDGRRCGNVDDLELSSTREDELRVVAILSGPPAWAGRGALGRLAAKLARGALVRIPWEEVDRVDSAVHLKRPAAELRLGRGDDRAARIVERLPGSGR